MKRLIRKTGLLSFIMASLIASSAMAAEGSEEIMGHLNSINQYDSTINVRVEVPGLLGPVSRDVDLDLAADVRWVICLGTSCSERTGMEGSWMLRDYSAYEPYGIMVEGSDVTMVRTGDAVTEVWVSLK